MEEFVLDDPLAGRRGGPARTGGAYNLRTGPRSAQEKSLAALRRDFKIIGAPSFLYTQAHTYLENCPQIKVMNMLTLAHVIEYIYEMGYNPKNGKAPLLEFNDSMKRHIAELIKSFFPTGLTDVDRVTKDFIATFQRYANLYHKFAVDVELNNH